MRRATIRSGKFLYVRVEVVGQSVRVAAGLDGALQSENGHCLTLSEARRLRGALLAAIATVEAKRAGRGA
jgi:hypothetical protein